jgi:membrane protease YdiL (CAAX protease family)
MPSTDYPVRRDDGSLDRPTILGLLAALLGLPALSLVFQASSADPGPTVGTVLQWLPAVFVLGVTLRWEDRSLRSLGLRRPEPVDLAYLLAATVLGFLALAATGPLVESLGLAQSDRTGLGVREAGVGVALMRAVTVGVVEELLYRGYAIERLAEYTDSVLLAGALSWGVFTVAHAATWQAGDLLQIALAALVFTGVYVRRRSLFPVVGAHVLIWLLGVLGTIYG